MSKSYLNLSKAKSLADEWFKNYSWNLVRWKIEHESFNAATKIYTIEGLRLSFKIPDQLQQFQFDLFIIQDSNGNWIIDETRIYQESYAVDSSLDLTNFSCGDKYQQP